VSAGRRSIPLLIVVAVGPGERLGVLELLDSARAYLRGPYRAIVVDDTGDVATWWALRRYPEVDVLRNWRRRGLQHLLGSLQRGYRHALEQYDFQAVLKLDTDALITGPGLDADILTLVQAHPTAGVFGSQTWRERQDDFWKERLEANLPMWGPIMERAERYGYQRGEAVLGGAYVVTHACLAGWAQEGFLGITPTGLRIAEDVTFSLFARALGYELHDVSGPSDPFALAYRGLPMPPHSLLARGKKVVHSVKLGAEDLRHRAVFARARHRAAGPSVSRTRSARLRTWLRWRATAARALDEGRPRRARAILWRCLSVVPGQPEVWIGLVASLLPTTLYRGLHLARSCWYRWLARRRGRWGNPA
jgi:hypothetical protein